MRRVMENEYLRLDRSARFGGCHKWIHFKRMLFGLRAPSPGCVQVHRLGDDHQEMRGYLQGEGICYSWC